MKLTMFGGSPDREISCRAKRKAGFGSAEPYGPWVFGYIVVERTRKDDVDTLVCMYTKKDPFNKCYVEPWSVGQYIGKHDKNGIPIFEHDIVLWRGGGPLDGFSRRIVIWSEKRAGFSLRHSDPDFDHADPIYDDMSDWEVIGNIFDTPEPIGL